MTFLSMPLKDCRNTPYLDLPRGGCQASTAKHDLALQNQVETRVDCSTIPQYTLTWITVQSLP
jgi:hypothetical protein